MSVSVGSSLYNWIHCPWKWTQGEKDWVNANWDELALSENISYIQDSVMIERVYMLLENQVIESELLILGSHSNVMLLSLF